MNSCRVPLQKTESLIYCALFRKFRTLSAHAYGNRQRIATMNNMKLPIFSIGAPMIMSSSSALASAKSQGNMDLYSQSRGIRSRLAALSSYSLTIMAFWGTLTLRNARWVTTWSVFTNCHTSWRDEAKSKFTTNPPPMKLLAAEPAVAAASFNSAIISLSPDNCGGTRASTTWSGFSRIVSLSDDCSPLNSSVAGSRADTVRRSLLSGPSVEMYKGFSNWIFRDI